MILLWALFYKRATFRTPRRVAATAREVVNQKLPRPARVSAQHPALRAKIMMRKPPRRVPLSGPRVPAPILGPTPDYCRRAAAPRVSERRGPCLVTNPAAHSTSSLVRVGVSGTQCRPAGAWTQCHAGPGPGDQWLSPSLCLYDRPGRLSASDRDQRRVRLSQCRPGRLTQWQCQ